MISPENIGVSTNTESRHFLYYATFGGPWGYRKGSRRSARRRPRRVRDLVVAMVAGGTIGTVRSLGRSYHVGSRARENASCPPLI